MLKFLLKIRTFLRALMKKRYFKVAVKAGYEAWDEVDKEWDGKPLSKDRYQDEDGNWLPGGEEDYDEEKNLRRVRWFSIAKEIAIAAIGVKYPGLTDLLMIVLGRIGLEKKLS